jgi:ubiquinone/menaquinone biosynthesis C-methylase UbiE
MVEIRDRVKAARSFVEAKEANKDKVYLDIGCGENKQAPYFIGIDRREMEGIDVVWDVEEFPWPIPDDVADLAIASHLVEHIKPWLTLQFFDEVWRILKVESKFAIAAPYATSEGYYQDPTHCSPYNQATFQYFDPTFPLWQIYKPKPWKIYKGYPAYSVNGSIEVVMAKLEQQDDPNYYLDKAIKEHLDEKYQGQLPTSF